ncbi:MAG TPA: NFACT RNA binding domain-containing protein, partial [Rhodothermales bacterium]|nr:NFACT RNA binding domain-containing protein [Rhodothermales bacterium]
MTFYVLHALVRDWQDLVGATLTAAYSQEADALRLAWETGDDEGWTVHVHVRPVRLFRTEGEGRRARRNTATLLDAATGRRLRAVRTAERDRVVFFDLDDGTALQAVLYGPRANVLHVGPDGIVRDAFQRAARVAGMAAPLPTPAPFPESPEALASWFGGSGLLATRLARAVPTFDALLAAEALHRAGLSEAERPHAADVARLFEVVQALDADARAAPAPAVLWSGDVPEAVALVPLTHPHGLRAEPATSVDAAVRAFHRRRLATESFTRRHAALVARLDAALERATQREARMLEELARPSRADDVERDANVLLAAAHTIPPGAAEAIVPDLYGPGTRTLALDPALSAAENAERLYARARRTREARRHAEARFDAIIEARTALERLAAEVRTLASADALDAFLAREGPALEPLLRESGPAEGGREPFHRIPLGHGYEAWVGRSAADNDTLTLRHARPFDLWLHARGVSGSHVVVRLPSRTAVAPKPVVARAAELAAFYSKARTSALVPVTVTPRKYVRKRKGSPPGAVVVERE